MYALALFAALVAPGAAFAQETPATDLQSTIRMEILSDPRSAGMTQAQIDAMVTALTVQAQKKGITAHDITWRPQATTGYSGLGKCGSLPGALCAINESFGLSGADTTIPIWLGITSALLALIIGALLEMHHLKVKKARTAAR